MKLKINEVTSSPPPPQYNGSYRVSWGSPAVTCDFTHSIVLRKWLRSVGLTKRTIIVYFAVDLLECVLIGMDKQLLMLFVSLFYVGFISDL